MRLLHEPWQAYMWLVPGERLPASLTELRLLQWPPIHSSHDKSGWQLVFDQSRMSTRSCRLPCATGMSKRVTTFILIHILGSLGWWRWQLQCNMFVKQCCLKAGIHVITGTEVYSHLLQLPHLRHLTVCPPPPQSTTSDFWCGTLLITVAMHALVSPSCAVISLMVT